MSYLGRKGAVAPLTSGDIPDGVIEGRDIAFFENGSTTQNLSGTYSTERMYLNDSYTLTGDVTITGHLALGTVGDADVVITDDGSTRTITGSGTLETGELMPKRRETLTGMTGELGSAVTGSPNLNLTTGLANASTTFPAGHVIQTTYNTYNSANSANTNSTTFAKVSDGSSNYHWGGTITNVTSGNDVLITMSFTQRHGNSGVIETGGSCGIYRESTIIMEPSNYDGYLYKWAWESHALGTQSVINFIDTSPVVGTNNYYLGYKAFNSSSNFHIKSASANMPFQCILMEIQGGV